MINYNYKLINKTIKNDENVDKYVGDILLFEVDDLKELNLDYKDCKVFRTARHKNDMPTIFRLGFLDDSMNDATIKISETGSSLLKSTSNLIISDHLTILGNDKSVFVVSFLGGKKHLIRVEIHLDDFANFAEMKIYAEINKLLKPNEEFITEDLELYNSDSAKNAIDDFANKKIKGISVKNKKCPSVYCTWYYYGRYINLYDCVTNLDEIKNRNLPLDTFQIDDGWENNIGDWEGNKNFFYDMKNVASEIKKYGLIPGLWTSPFIFERKSKFYKQHKNWILKNSKGKPIIFEMNKHKYFIVDISIKETWDYFEKLYARLTNDYGFKYHKLDFTRAPITAVDADYKNKYITIVEAYRNAVLSIRKGMGDSFFLMCGGLYDPLIGIVDAQRSGSDVLSMWSAQNRGGKTLPFTMKQSLLRYYMNNWWYNDPDSYVIRRNTKKFKGLKLSLGLLTDDEVKTSTLNQLIGGGLFSMSEPLNKIDKDRLDNIKHILPIKKVNIELVDIMNTPRYPNIIRVKDYDNNFYLVLINYDDKEDKKLKINKDFVTGNKNTNKKYLYDFYSNKYDENELEVILKPHSSTLIKLVDDINDITKKEHYLD